MEWLVTIEIPYIQFKSADAHQSADGTTVSSPSSPSLLSITVASEEVNSLPLLLGPSLNPGEAPQAI